MITILGRALLVALILQGVRLSFREIELDSQAYPLSATAQPTLEIIIEKEMPPQNTFCSIELDPAGNSSAEEVKAALQCAKERQVIFCPLGGYGFNHSECWRDVYRYLTQTAAPPLPFETPLPTAYPE